MERVQAAFWCYSVKGSKKLDIVWKMSFYRLMLRTLQVEHPFTGKYFLMRAGGQAGASSTIAAILGSVSSRRERF